MAAADSNETPFLRMPSSGSEHHVDTYKEEEVELCQDSHALTYCIQGESVKTDFDPIPDFALANETFPVGNNPNEMGLPRLADPPRLDEAKASMVEEPKEAEKEPGKTAGAPSPVIRKMTKALPDGVASANRFFSDKEWAERIEMVQKQMKKEELDLIIVTSPANIFWMSGYVFGIVIYFVTAVQVNGKILVSVMIAASTPLATTSSNAWLFPPRRNHSQWCGTWKGLAYRHALLSSTAMCSRIPKTQSLHW